ncbi:Aldo/keto reductase [Vararia minispora EC-137]|uniref:Aldo/keto reductase n=1 Tax=Vararia minispora EC-137 TaxID=1314806 RepID=A0ACB8QCY1_9AGAM|nr:Aldo/keto reductase [Vararia minispora EC-137]
MVIALDSPQPVFAPPPPDSVPDGPDDQPRPGRPLDTVGSLGSSALVFGAAAWSHFYNGEEVLTSDVPLRTIRLALRYGIRAFDTSPYYGMSEIVLGTTLRALAPDFPRSSYKLMTKCGRYGSTNFDYSPATIRRSVERSLARLHTSYLDVVYLHDCEFVAPLVAPRAEGVHVRALGAEADVYGLRAGEEAVVRGTGDEAILDAVAELRKMQEEGIVKNVGISGLPLPTLLRLALLVLHTPPYKPLDAVLSYSQLNLQNASLLTFAPALRTRAKVAHVLTASPLNMGLLTSAIPPWHPAPPAMQDAAGAAVQRCTDFPGGLPAVAIGWAVRAAEKGEETMPTVVGLSRLEEVHQAVKTWREVKDEVSAEALDAAAKSAIAAFEEKNVKDWTWASGLS